MKDFKQLLPSELLAQKFEKAKTLEKKQLLFQLWLEAIVKLNVSFHVGWLLQDQSSAPDSIKSKLVRFIQRPPSIGTSLDLSRSINKLMRQRGEKHDVIQRFAGLFSWMDPLLCSMLETRNKAVHGGTQISELMLEQLGDTIKSISGHDFYQGLRIAPGSWLAYGEMAGMQDVALLSELENSPLSPPFLILDNAKVFSVFPITTLKEEDGLIFWNKKAGNFGVYSDYTSGSDKVKIDSIVDLCGFPYESWKTRTDPLFERYLNSKERALEALVIDERASLEEVNQEIEFALRLETEIGIPQDERINPLEIGSALSNKASQNPNDSTVEFYYRKVFNLNGDSLRPELSAKLLEFQIDAVYQLLLIKKERSESLSGLIGITFYLLLQWLYKNHGSSSSIRKGKVVDLAYSKVFQAIEKKHSFGSRIGAIFSVVRKGTTTSFEEFEIARSYKNIDLEIDVSEHYLLSHLRYLSESILAKGLINDSFFNVVYPQSALSGISHRIGVILHAPAQISARLKEGDAEGAVDWTMERVRYLLGDPKRAGTQYHEFPDVPSAIYMLRVLAYLLRQQNEYGLASTVSCMPAVFAELENHSEISRVCMQLTGQTKSEHMTLGEIQFGLEEERLLLMIHADVELWAALHGHHDKDRLLEMRTALMNQNTEDLNLGYWISLFHNVQRESDMSLTVQAELEQARSNWYLKFELWSLAKDSLNRLLRFDGNYRMTALLNLNSTCLRSRDFEGFIGSLGLLEKITSPVKGVSRYLEWVYEIEVDKYADILADTTGNSPCPCGSGKKVKTCHLRPRQFVASTLSKTNDEVKWK